MEEELLFHPACLEFPPMTGAALLAFTEDAKRTGIRHPAVYWTRPDGKKEYLDGRNRLLVGRQESIPVPEVEYSGRPEDIRAWILSENLQGRRHLTSAQKAAIAVKYRRIMISEGQWEDGQRWADDLAEKFGTNRNYVFDLDPMVDCAPHILEDVVHGRVGMNDAKERLKKERAAARKAEQESTEPDSQEEAENLDREEAEADHESNGKVSENPEKITRPSVTDASGEVVPEKFREAFTSRNLYDEVFAKATEIERLVGEIFAGQGGLWGDEREANAHLGNFVNHLRMAAPYRVCPDCDGEGVLQATPRQKRQRCHRCQKNGFVNEARYEGEFSIEKEIV